MISTLHIWMWMLHCWSMVKGSELAQVQSLWVWADLHFYVLTWLLLTCLALLAKHLLPRYYQFLVAFIFDFEKMIGWNSSLIPIHWDLHRGVIWGQASISFILVVAAGLFWKYFKFFLFLLFLFFAMMKVFSAPCLPFVFGMFSQENSAPSHKVTILSFFT